LPILHHGDLIGRMDVKAHRGEQKFEVKSLYLEPEISPNLSLATDLVNAFSACAEWHKTPELSVQKCVPVELAEMIRSKLPSAVSS
jgi:uncharacterized protein YcaQ